MKRPIENTAQVSENNKLLALYGSVSDHQKLSDAVKVAEEWFIEDVSNSNLEHYGVHTSAVHGFDDVRVQAFIVAIPSDSFDQMAQKAYMAFTSHFLDDFFDRPDLPPFPADMKKGRQDIHNLINSAGDLGGFTELMSRKANTADAFYKGIHRLMYGGLIPLAETPEEQETYLKEYKELSKRFVNASVTEAINTIRDIPYWTTTKTIQELLWSPESEVDMTLAELWSIVYAPALYLHDFEEEQNTGELNFFDSSLPSLEEMQLMLSIGKQCIPKSHDRLLHKRLEQLRFLITAFSHVLPKQIEESYRILVRELEHKVA